MKRLDRAAVRCARPPASVPGAPERLNAELAPALANADLIRLFHDQALMNALSNAEVRSQLTNDSLVRWLSQPYAAELFADGLFVTRSVRPSSSTPSTRTASRRLSSHLSSKRRSSTDSRPAVPAT
jgi:hypothetical protein